VQRLCPWPEGSLLYFVIAEKRYAYDIEYAAMSDGQSALGIGIPQSRVVCGVVMVCDALQDFADQSA